MFAILFLKGVHSEMLHIWKAYLTLEIVQDKCPKYNGSSILLFPTHVCVQQFTVGLIPWNEYYSKIENYLTEILVLSWVIRKKLYLYRIPLYSVCVQFRQIYLFIFNLHFKRQVGGFLQMLQFPPPIKVTATI